MQSYLYYISDFIQDTCVVVVFAYLLTRVRIVRILLREQLTLRQSGILGFLLGLIGLTEMVIPQVGFKYASESLCIAFAASIGGIQVVLLTAIILALGSCIEPSRNPLSLLPAMGMSILLAPYVRRAASLSPRLLAGFLTGVLVQTARLMAATGLRYLSGKPMMSPVALLSIPTNGIGLMLLLLVISDAQVRADSEQFRLDSEKERADRERAYALAIESQLSALRARVHPHFLFNALNSIAELCFIAPQRAESACLSLSKLMRQVLETSVESDIPLSQEIATTCAYLKIEQERLGHRLTTEWRTDPACETIHVLPFALQVLVENAVNHGVAPKLSAGKVIITVRPYKHGTLFAVQDDGVGMPSESRPAQKPKEGYSTHGVQIMNEQLILRYGPRARLRYFSKQDKGTMVVFALPNNSAPEINGKKKL